MDYRCDGPLKSAAMTVTPPFLAACSHTALAPVPTPSPRIPKAQGSSCNFSVDNWLVFVPAGLKFLLAGVEM